MEKKEFRIAFQRNLNLNLKMFNLFYSSFHYVAEAGLKLQILFLL